jgi:hypothetical protein
MDEALQEDASTLRIAGLAIKIELHDVARCHERRRKRARHQEPIRRRWMAH